MIELTQVPKYVIIEDLEEILEELRTDKYPFIAMNISITFTERRVSRLVSESVAVGKQIIVTMATVTGEDQDGG